MKFSYRRYAVDASPAQPGAEIIYRPVIPFRLIGFLEYFDGKFSYAAKFVELVRKRNVSQQIC